MSADDVFIDETSYHASGLVWYCSGFYPFSKIVCGHYHILVAEKGEREFEKVNAYSMKEFGDWDRM